MHEHGHIILGARPDWEGGAALALPLADRRRHLYAVGKTGTGKSTFLRTLLAQDIAAGRGVGLLDPHGDLAEELLDCIPRSRVREVVYLDPADLEFPPGLNVLAGVPPDHRPLMASGVVEACRGFWGESWGPRLEYVLYNAVAALLDYPEASLLALPKLLTDAGFRRAVLAHVLDPLVRLFWEEEFPQLMQATRGEAITPLQNKIGRLLAPPLRNILGQRRSTIDPAAIMDEGRVFIANLGKGRMGADKANVLGSLLLSQFQLAAMRRASRPEEQRRDFTLYIDEFHNFTTAAFAATLSEARKYRLSLVLAHQYLDQLSEELRHAIFGNIGSLVVFRVGQRDAEMLTRELEYEFPADDLIGLGVGEVRVRLLSEGLPATPCRGYTFLEESLRHGRGRQIKNYSRERDGTPQGRVERSVRRFLRPRQTRG